MTSLPTPCARPDCQGGHITVTGYCDTCLRLSPDQVPSAPAQPAAEPAKSQPRPTAPAVDALDNDGLLVLPHISSPEPSEAASTTARAPTGGRRCGVDNCTGIIGVAYDGGPALDEGYCPSCGRDYSFKPKLRPGDRVGDHYQVLGYLAVGGLGWVYLAEDTRVQDLHVVLKGLINSGDAAARRSAVEERRSLTTLHHRDIVRIVTHVQHQAPGETTPTGYIVMEYVGGRTLHWIRYAPEEELTRLFGGTFGIGHVITYGCKILGALEYLHEQGLLYCDMKPDNVIHYGRDIKVIDLGAIRRIDDHSSNLVYTPDYAPPKKERDERGFHVDTDLFTVGHTLKALAARAAPATGLAARSFDELIRRATHREPAARFTSAAEMSRQLWEVLREHQALSGHEPYPERSTRFEPTAAVFGSALGTVPSLDHWTRRPGPEVPEPPIGAPDPRDTARALPVPIPDPRDHAAVLLGGLAAGNPERIAEQAEQDPALNTVETALWLCRAYLDAGNADEADRWLREADDRSGEYDWRIFWHQGLLHLRDGEVQKAEGEFAATYAALPGESAPKLALGYCAEYLDAAERQTAAYYEAVWRRDRTQGSAAFGLARLHLRRGDRQQAVAVLDEVPTTSRHYDAARIAAIRVLTGRLPGSGPTATQLGEADRRLARLRTHAPHLVGSGAWDRLVTEVQENAYACRPPGGWGREFPDGELFGRADTPRELGELLSRSLKRLADQAGSATERGDLLDQAYAVLPEAVGLRDVLRSRRRTT
ncbi:tetratricopeptide repeat protein [Streptomyces cellulosae]|uniref:non-specific serine/threonine protein kinase n=1 Tax=Streptomyces cellulosae TaxID=1968 RepID=A0ABW7Y9E3_STRCE